MASTIKVSKRVTQNSDYTYRLQAWVSETSDNIPSEIFLHRTVPGVDAWEGPAAAYYGICSYADLLNYAVDVSDTSSNFFRKSGIDLDFTSVSVLDATWDAVVTGVQLLVNDIVRTYSAVSSDVSYSGTNFDVVAGVKHYASASYSYLLTLEATESIFVVEKQNDGVPELVSIASLADMSTYEATAANTGYYRTDSLTLAFGEESLYVLAKAALDADFAALDAELTDPGILVVGEGDESLTNVEVVGPTTYYFGD